MNTTTIVCVALYVLPVLLNRSLYRFASKRGIFLAEDCRVSVVWFAPAINLIAGVILAFFLLNEIKDGWMPKSKLISKFFNYDLKD